MTNDSLFDLRGKVAIVTGAAAGGLGHYSALALAEQGADIFLVDLEDRTEDLKESLAAIEATGRRGAVGFCDVSDEAAVDTVVSEAVNTFGRLDILMHNAGAMQRKDAFKMTLDEWRRVLDINLTGTWLMNRCVARKMVEAGSGKIVNVSTVYTNIVGPMPESSYYASKAGIANLTRGLASEWGKRGVNVNSLAPGVFYPTNMTRPLSENSERLEWMKNRTLLGRLGDPEHDLKGAVIFLASPASDYVTGQVLFVDGGWTAW